MIQFLLEPSKPDLPTPAIFLDRDGVINYRRPGDYVLTWSQFTIMPGIVNALRDLSRLQLPMIIISNQAAVGKGLLAPETLRDITFRLHKELLRQSVSLGGCYYCPHKPADRCECRKPRPGLLYRAAADFNLDLRRSIFIGDSETDIQAARLAGCQPILFAQDPNRANANYSLDDVHHALTAEKLFGVSCRALADCGGIA